MQNQPGKEPHDVDSQEVALVQHDALAKIGRGPGRDSETDLAGVRTLGRSRQLSSALDRVLSADISLA